MADPEYISEAESRIFTYMKIWQDHRTGKWCADLEEEMLKNDTGPRPPVGKLPGSPDDMEFRARRFTKPGGKLIVRMILEPVQNVTHGWAEVPFFLTEAAAERMLRRWIADNRPDIVAVCYNETREAIAYRRRQDND